MGNKKVKAVLGDLLTLYPELEGRKMLPKYGNSDGLARGWFLHVQHGCEAVMLLSKHGLHYETPAIRRTIIEHTVALRWLRRDGAKIGGTLGRGITFGIGKLDRAAAVAGWTERPDKKAMAFLQQLSDASDNSQDAMNNFTRLTQEIGAQQEFVAYLFETQFAHPSIASSVMHGQDIPSYNRANQITFCCLYLLWALEHMNNMYMPTPWSNLLVSYAPRISKAVAQMDR